jgi:hypothetical protein
MGGKGEKYGRGGKGEKYGGGGQRERRKNGNRGRDMSQSTPGNTGNEKPRKFVYPETVFLNV